MYSQLNDKVLSDRLSVADILSSMANGVEESNHPVACTTTIDGLTCGIPTRTTPTLTPTTLRNIEESFMEFHTIPPAPLVHQHQAGFAPPIVSFPGIPKQEEPQWMDDCMHSSDRSLDSPRPSSDTSTSSRPSKSGRTGGRRPIKDERLSPEEEERRRIRRERNKLAAARCRKRRMELTNNLMNETDGLEEKRQTLQNEILALQRQKSDIEFLLEAHKATCKLNSYQPKAKVLDVKPPISRMKYQRPNSLSLSSSYNMVDAPIKSSSNYTAVSEINTSLNTPSTGLFHFDGIMEGNAPTSASSGLPCVMSSCGGQQRSSSSDLSSPDSMAPAKLVSL